MFIQNEFVPRIKASQQNCLSK